MLDRSPTMWNHCKVEQAKRAEQAGSIRWCKQWRILWCYDEDVDEVLEMMWFKEEPLINNEIQPIKTFGDLKRLQSSTHHCPQHIRPIALLRCSNGNWRYVWWTAMIVRDVSTNWHWMSSIKNSCIRGKWLCMTCSNKKVWTLIFVKKIAHLTRMRT